MAIEKVLECIPQMVVRCDKEGRIKYANKKWIGYCREGWIQLEEGQGSKEEKEKEEESWINIVHPEDEKETKQKWEEHVAVGSPFEITHRLRNNNGEYKWHRSNSSKLEMESTDYLITNTDVHTEYALMQAFRESYSREEAFDRRILHNSDPILTIAASDGTILRINNAVSTHFQYSSEELVGKPCTVLMEEKTALRHLGENGYFEKFRRFISKGQGTSGNASVGFSKQIHVTKKDGKRVPVSLVVDSYTHADNPIRSSPSTPSTPASPPSFPSSPASYSFGPSSPSSLVYIVVLRPINPDISIQQQINKSKDQFLSTISHELRTPLFGLLGTISLLHSQIVDQSTLDDVAQMEINVMSLLSIVNNMIDFYLLNQLSTVPVYLPFDTSKLVADICERMSGFKQPGVEFTYMVTDTPPLLVSDPNFIEHALVNLLSNALRFTHAGKVQVQVSLTNSADDTSISLQPGQGALRITVSDTGIGIEPEFYPQLFQPFSQTDSSDQRAYKGVGLGLAITKSVMDMLGGSITFTSIPGHGSEFHALIPVELLQLSEDEPRSEPEPTKPQNLEPKSEEPTKPQLDEVQHEVQPQEHELHSSELPTLSEIPMDSVKPASPIIRPSFSPRRDPPSSYSPPTFSQKRRLSSPLLSQFLRPEENNFPTPSRIKPSFLATIHSPTQPPSCPFTPNSSSSSSPLPDLHLSLPDQTPAPALQHAKSLKKYPSSPSLHTPQKPDFSTPPPIKTNFSTPQIVDGSNSHEIGTLKKRLLVVEDNSMNQLIIKRMLQRLECDVVLAKHGGEALEILFDTESEKYVGYSQFDTVLADCQMPVMNGYKVAEQIRSWEALQRGSPHMLVLALSASISADNEAKCLESGMDGFIAKPVTVTMLYHYLTSYYSLVDLQGKGKAQ